MTINTADKIKARFPFLDVFDKINSDGLVFVRKVHYDENMRLIEMRIEVKKIHSLIAGASVEYWITSRVVSVPDLPGMPYVDNAKTRVVHTKGDLFREIEKRMKDEYKQTV